MELRRYCATGKGKTETVQATEFVAFWADAKAINALDSNGLEWKLAGRVSLKDIEEGVTGLTRAHRRVLVLASKVDRLMSRPGQAPEHYCVLLGREFPVSNAHKADLQSLYRAQAARYGFSAMCAQVAA